MPHLLLTRGYRLRLSPTTSTNESPTSGRPLRAPTPVFRDIVTADRFSGFEPVTTDAICLLVNDAADKYSMKNAMPTWLLKTSIDLLVGNICNGSVGILAPNYVCLDTKMTILNVLEAEII